MDSRTECETTKYKRHVWHGLGRPCGAVANEAEGITEIVGHITCPDCLNDKTLDAEIIYEDILDCEVVGD